MVYFKRGEIKLAHLGVLILIVILGVASFSVLSNWQNFHLSTSKMIQKQPDSLTIPVNSKNNFVKLEFTDVLQNGHIMGVLDVDEGAVLISPFDGIVTDVNFLRNSTYYGDEAIVYTLQNMKTNDIMTFILPSKSKVIATAHTKLLRGEPFSMYVGGSLGGSVSGKEILFDYYSITSGKYGFEDSELWVSGKPIFLE